MGRALITHDRLLALLAYEPDTGRFFWRVSKNRMAAGDEAGTQRPDRYWQITLDGRQYLRHRLAWFYIHGEWPPHGIDHINRVRGDDRQINLRPATQSENGANVPARRSADPNHVKGIHWRPDAKRWRVLIMKGGKVIHVGYFKTQDEAKAAYARAAKKHFGEFARSE